MSIQKNITQIKERIPGHITLVAVSKTKPASAILEAYEVGHRVFGENKIQEMAQKWEQLPKDIQWHMIGHVQRNKVKYMAPFVSLIHGVDSLKLLQEIDKQAKKHDRVINCLLQVHIAQEDTKFGLSATELETLVHSHEAKTLENVHIKGLMGMASFTDDGEQIRKEFRSLRVLFDGLAQKLQGFDTLSMGMSGDFKLAMEEGSTMVRIGSSIFGVRNYP